MHHDVPRQRALILFPHAVSDPSPDRGDSRHWTGWAALACYAALGVALWWQSIDIAFMVLPVLLRELLTAPRSPRAGSGRGSWAVYLSALLPLALVPFAGTLHPEWLAATRDRALLTAGMAIWAIGSLMVLSTLWSLSQASTSESPWLGDRPPIYPAYLMTLAGLWLCHPTLPFAALLGAWLVPLAIRAHHEVQAARAALPTRDESHQRADALGPRLASLIAARDGLESAEVVSVAAQRAAARPAAAATPSALPGARRADRVPSQELATDRSDAQEQGAGNGAGGSGEQHGGGNGAGPQPVHGRSASRSMRRPRIDRIVPGLGRISVTPMVHCSASCTVEVTSGGRRRRHHATDCEVARRCRTIDRLVECGQLEVLHAIKTGALTVDEVHAAHEASRLDA